MRVILAAAILAGLVGAAKGDPIGIDKAPDILAAAATSVGLKGVLFNQEGCDSAVDFICDVVGQNPDGSLTARFLMKSAGPGQPVDHFDLFFSIDPAGTPLQFLNAAVVTTALGGVPTTVGEETKFIGELAATAADEDGMVSQPFHGTTQTIVVFEDTGMMLSIQLAPPP